MLRRPSPPGPRGRLLGGHIHEFSNLLDFLPRCAREFGDIASFRFGPRRLVLVNHPNLIEQILVTDARHYRKHAGQRLVRALLGDGLVTSEGETWLRQRRLAQPPFLKNRVDAFAPVMTDQIHRHIADWHAGQKLDLHAEMVALAGRIAMATLFGAASELDLRTFNDAIKAVAEGVESRFRRLVNLPDWMPTAENRRLNRALSELNGVAYRLIRGGRGRSTGTDLLSLLGNARHENGSAMPDAQLRDEMVTMFMAGTDTTGLTLTWAWHLLAGHPDAEERLLAEWQTVLRKRTPSAADVPKMPFTECVILETMRIRPPVYVIGREAAEPVELGGYRLRRGSIVLLSQWVTHRDPRWFDEPDQFRPERWENGFVNRIPKYAYFPFGGGPRLCLGNAFALLEATLCLATIGPRFRFAPNPGHPVEPAPSTSLRPKQGMPVTLESRTTAPSSPEINARPGECRALR
jgi:cytochrome P450